MSQVDIAALAQAAYASYNDALNGAPLILWDDLGSDEHAAWIEAVTRVCELVIPKEAA